MGCMPPSQLPPDIVQYLKTLTLHDGYSDESRGFQTWHCRSFGFDDTLDAFVIEDVVHEYRITSGWEKELRFYVPRDHGLRLVHAFRDDGRAELKGMGVRTEQEKDWDEEDCMTPGRIIVQPHHAGGALVVQGAALKLEKLVYWPAGIGMECNEDGVKDAVVQALGRLV